MEKRDIKINKKSGRPRLQHRCCVIKLSNFLKNLKPKQRASIEATAFGPLLSLPELKVSQNLMHELLQRWCIKKKAFKIGLQYVNFCLRDIAFILGLRVVDIEGGNVMDSSRKCDILKQFFGEKTIVKQRDVEVALEKCSHNDYFEEYTRLALVYIMVTFLFPNSSTSISSKFIAMVEDLSKFNRMAWGKFVYEKLVESLCVASKKLATYTRSKRFSRVVHGREASKGGNNSGNSVTLHGCAIAIQVWTFEHIPLLQPQSLVLSFPRIIKYQAMCYNGEGHSKSNWDLAVLMVQTVEWDSVIEVLYPTTVELNEAVIREVLDIGNGTNSVLTLIMEEYIELLRRQNYSLHKDQNHLKCIFLSVYFMQMVKLKLDGARAHLERKNVGYSFDNCDKIFIPGHWDGNHWVLYVLNMKEKRLEFYNSLNTTHHCNNDIVDLVDFFDKNFFSMYDWQYKHFLDIPQQENGHDCGIFVLKYIECLAQGETLNFSQSDMPSFRKKLIADIQANT